MSQLDQSPPPRINTDLGVEILASDLAVSNESPGLKGT